MTAQSTPSPQGTAPTQQQLLGIYTTVYLVCSIVVVRLVLLPSHKAGPYKAHVLIGIASLALSFLWYHLSQPTSRRTLGMLFVCQSTLILLLSLAGPQYFLALLFFLPVCSGIMLYFPGMTGLLGICTFASTSLLVRSLNFGALPDDSSHYLLYAGFFLVGSYINAFVQAKEAYRESQSLLQELQESHAQLQEHATQVEELAITKERNRLARELHDSVSQMLFSMTLLTQSALMRLERDPEEARKPIQQIQQTADNALKEMRALIFQLRPPQESADFLTLLQDFIEELQHRHPLKATLHLPDNIALPPDITHHLLRIVQEALHNVVKHTPSRDVCVAIAHTSEQLKIDITDDGPGFTLREEKPSTLGLKIMHERAELIGATLQFEVQPEGGTCVSISRPHTDTDDSDDDNAD